MIEQRLSEPVLPVRDRASLYDKGWIVATDGDIRLSAPNGVGGPRTVSTCPSCLIGKLLTGLATHGRDYDSDNGSGAHG